MVASEESMTEEAKASEHEEGDEASPGPTDTLFAFDVPGGIQAGTLMKVTAPDGVMLHIPLPGNVHAGDRMCMQKNLETGKWGIKHVVRGEVPAISVEPNGQVTRRSNAELEKDLLESNVCTVVLTTTKGDIRLRIVPSWAPKGAQRFLQLVTDKYYDDVAIYRAVPGFLIQFGVISDMEKTAKYEAALLASAELLVASAGSSQFSGLFLPAGLSWEQYPVKWDDVSYTIGRSGDVSAQIGEEEQ